MVRRFRLAPLPVFFSCLLAGTACEGPLELEPGEFSLSVIVCGFDCFRDVTWQADGEVTGRVHAEECRGRASPDELRSLADAASLARALGREDHLELRGADCLVGYFDIRAVAGPHEGEHNEFSYAHGCGVEDGWDPAIRALLDAALAPLDRICE